MDSADIYRHPTLVFHDVFDDDTIVLTTDLMVDAIATWNSLTHNRLLYSVEREFDVTFSTADVVELKNVGDFVALVQRKLER